MHAWLSGAQASTHAKKVAHGLPTSQASSSVQQAPCAHVLHAAVPVSELPALGCPLDDEEVAVGPGPAVDDDAPPPLDELAPPVPALVEVALVDAATVAVGSPGSYGSTHAPSSHTRSPRQSVSTTHPSLE